MSHAAAELQAPPPPPAPARPGVLGTTARALGWVNAKVFTLCLLALVAAAVILTGSVFLRYFLKAPTDWQDEVSVFLMVGATFFSGAYVQAYRGHVGIAALDALLPPRANRVRGLVCDVLSLLFCTFFAWKSWTLTHEAWSEHQTTSSAWAPPLSVPYALMAFGMTLLSLQLLQQVLERLAGHAPPSR